MRVAIVSVLSLVPILWLSILAVRGDHAAALFYGVEVKRVFVRDGKEPDVFRCVLPISLCPAAFLSFPRYAVPELEQARARSFDGRTGAPIAAYIKGGGRFQQWLAKFEPGGKPCFIIFRALPTELSPPEFLVEVIGRVGEQQIEALFGQVPEYFEGIAADDLVMDGGRGFLLVCEDYAIPQRITVDLVQLDGPVSRGPCLFITFHRPKDSIGKVPGGRPATRLTLEIARDNLNSFGYNPIFSESLQAF